MNFFLWTFGALYIWNATSNIINRQIARYFNHPVLITSLLKESILFVGTYFFAVRAGFTYPETIAAALVGIDVAATALSFGIIVALDKFLSLDRVWIDELIFLFRTIRLVGMSLYILGWAVQSGIVFSGV